MVRTLPWATGSSKVSAQAIKKREPVTVKSVREGRPSGADFEDDDQYEMVVEDLEMIALELIKPRIAAEEPDDISPAASPSVVPSTDALHHLLDSSSMPASLTTLKRRKPRAEVEELDMAKTGIILSSDGSPPGAMAPPLQELSVDSDQMPTEQEVKKAFCFPERDLSSKASSILDLLRTSKASPSIFNLSRSKKREALEGQEAPPVKKLASARDLYGF